MTNRITKEEIEEFINPIPLGNRLKPKKEPKPKAEPKKKVELKKTVAPKKSFANVLVDSDSDTDEEIIYISSKQKSKIEQEIKETPKKQKIEQPKKEINDNYKNELDMLKNELNELKKLKEQKIQPIEPPKQNNSLKFNVLNEVQRKIINF